MCPSCSGTIESLGSQVARRQGFVRWLLRPAVVAAVLALVFSVKSGVTGAVLGGLLGFVLGMVYQAMVRVKRPR